MFSFKSSFKQQIDQLAQLHLQACQTALTILEKLPSEGLEERAAILIRAQIAFSATSVATTLLTTLKTMQVSEDVSDQEVELLVRAFREHLTISISKLREDGAESNVIPFKAT